MGLLNNAIPYSLIVWGQSFIGSALASILNANTPLFTVNVAHFFTRDERFDTPKLIGIVFGILGVTIMISADAPATIDGRIFRIFSKMDLDGSS